MAAVDIEEGKGLLNPHECESGDALRVFIFFPLKFPKNIPLTLFNWKKFMIVAWGIQLMFFVSLAGLIKPHWTFYTKVAIITAAVAPLIGYCMVLLNMFNGGWGRENSRFWCHMRIMYMAGYNSIRWGISSVVDPCITIAACLVTGDSVTNSIRAGICVVYCYYILAEKERQKSQAIEWDKFKNDFDVDLQNVNDVQQRNLQNVPIEPIIFCITFNIIPWVVAGSNIGFFIMIYGLAICTNAYRYCSSSQTFVVTDTQYDIIQCIFRTGILWSFIWLV